ncbi:MAG: hypothetical protein HYU52_09525 [Acidobacteria bacterium]|nr:hypothetical protein [Acidobacteriota bacterium]
MHKMKSLPVRRLSSILAPISRALRETYGLTRLAIGGGSAPALLDHLFTGHALRMRDLDLLLIADREVEEPLVRRIGESLDAPELRFLPRYVYPRLRSRGEAEPWNAGWGLLWDANGVEVDLSIFHDDEALELNGLMNIDRILIPLESGSSLNEIAARMLSAASADQAVEEGLIDDPCGGYASWVHRSPVIVAWNDIHASPILSSIRIVRACASKLHLAHLHAELADPLRAAILQGHERGDRFVRVRNLLKLFHDDRAASELEMLHALGAFIHWIPEIGNLIEKLGHGGLVSLFAQADREGRKDADHHAAFALAGEQGADEASALRLEALLLNIPALKRDDVLDEIAIAEPTFANLVRSQMPRVAKRRAKSPSPSRRAAPKRPAAARAIGTV